jgi:pyruvate/2-oxoacid:ferredoxin oxidoreductase beta subunit
VTSKTNKLTNQQADSDVCQMSNELSHYEHCNLVHIIHGSELEVRSGLHHAWSTLNASFALLVSTSVPIADVSPT